MPRLAIGVHCMVSISVEDVSGSTGCTTCDPLQCGQRDDTWYTSFFFSILSLETHEVCPVLQWINVYVVTRMTSESSDGGRILLYIIVKCVVGSTLAKQTVGGSQTVHYTATVVISRMGCVLSHTKCAAGNGGSLGSMLVILKTPTIPIRSPVTPTPPMMVTINTPSRLT